MRSQHADNPFHRIEAWNGTHFRSAELWEVGVYVLVPHHESEHLGTQCCETLKFQMNVLERFQRGIDEEEQTSCRSGELGHNRFSNETGGQPFDSAGNDVDIGGLNTTDDHSYETDRDADGPFMHTLDALLQKKGDHPPAEGEDEDTHDPDTNPLLPPNYMPHEWPQHPPQSPSLGQVSVDIPHKDVLHNPYVRIVHSNGVHNMALVFCTCHGRESTHNDLMVERLIPTSFTRYRTLFTHAVLDDFRLSNLECKASAYQYFQKLRRQTSPLAPDTVPNLYHELRRMSRLWRWMKKLKWAGFGHIPQDQQTEPTAGELANFCPACPQPGINLPEEWTKDEKR
jgi:hypothetical protein